MAGFTGPLFLIMDFTSSVIAIHNKRIINPSQSIPMRSRNRANAIIIRLKIEIMIVVLT